MSADDPKSVFRLLDRFRYESELLVMRTASILTLNGLMATTIAAGQTLPTFLKAFVATIMTVLNWTWLVRARSGQRVIDALDKEIFTFPPDEIPIDAKVRKRVIDERKPHWWTIDKKSRHRRTTSFFFSQVIPAGLLLCWVVGIATFSWPTPPGPGPIIPVAPAAPAAVVPPTPPLAPPPAGR
jgi:hypothetical protein